MLCAALFAGALFGCVSSWFLPLWCGAVIGVLFFLFFQLIAVFFHFSWMKQSFTAYLSAAKEWRRIAYDKSVKQSQFVPIDIDAVPLFAELKSTGVNPDRAGPVAVIA